MLLCGVFTSQLSDMESSLKVKDSYEGQTWDWNLWKAFKPYSSIRVFFVFENVQKSMNIALVWWISCWHLPKPELHSVPLIAIFVNNSPYSHWRSVHLMDETFLYFFHTNCHKQLHCFVFLSLARSDV